jgi:hypothetical protein
MAILVNKKILEENLYYQNNLLLSYKIEYPQFLTLNNKKRLNKLNKYYIDEALILQKQIKTEYFNNALEEYLFSVKNNYPVRQHEIMSDYQVTYNDNNILSLYFDLFQYLGGAHGITIRNSDTWDLNNKNKIYLSDLFKKSIDYQKYIINEVNQQIKYEMKNEDIFLYFSDFRKNVASKFDKDNFYLVPQGIMFYYQLYDIAPYVFGIPEFFIMKNINMNWPD